MTIIITFAAAFLKDSAAGVRNNIRFRV